MRQTTSRGGSGFTLVEVLVALTLMAFVLLPVMMGLSQALISTSESSITAAATSVARDKTEQLKALVLGSSSGFAALVSQPREPADLRPGDSFFEVEVTVETVRPDDSLHSGMKKAAVMVYRTGSDRPVTTLTTYLVPFGI
ncbi:MAG: prepilin-type N-terminal cleavage/methylation domain-containing protein [Armatimonadetes bacterium]|nr:prepilin-type N-terminal cleavage/methylation domain-containing protein [Armatimonadota bacterium]